MAILVEISNASITGVFIKFTKYISIYLSTTNMLVSDGKPFNIGHFTNYLW